MSSNSSDKEQQELPLPVADEAATNLRKHQSCHAQKLKTVLGILLIVGVVAAVGVCAAVFAPSKKNGKKSANEEFADLQTREHLYKRMTATHQLARKARGSRRGGRTEAITCESEMSNDTIPAAHIAGNGLEWPTTEAPTALNSYNDDTPGYRTSWYCKNRNGAFVDGGMVFNQTDRKLYVPKCGYYYVSSQVFYQVAQSQTRSVQHNIKVHRNCSPPGEDGHSRVVNQRDFSLHTVTSIGAGNGKDRQASSTYIGEIVKICTGGKIWVEIPQQDTPCCPYGLNTYLGAYFVAETNCLWPLPHQNN